MSRLRSSSECSLESDISDSDGSYKASASDTESDIEMEVRSRSRESLTPSNAKPNQMASGWSSVTSSESHPTIQLCSWPDLHPNPPLPWYLRRGKTQVHSSLSLSYLCITSQRQLLRSGVGMFDSNCDVLGAKILGENRCSYIKK